MNYQKAVRYATKLIRDYNAPYSPRDLVHDAYVEWWGYKQTDLFENKEGTVLKTIKNKHFNNLNTQYYQKDGEKLKKINILVSDGSDRRDFTVGEEKRGEIRTEEFTPSETKTPESILISKENVKDLNDSLSEFDRKVLDLRNQGYQKGEIEDILGTHNVKITKSIKNIKEQMHTRSPFNGCKLTIVERVKRKDFEKDKEEYLKNWEMGEDSDYNELYVQMTSKTNPKEGLLIKEKDSD